MSDDHQPEANGIFSGNATEVRSQEQQQNRADEHQTERSSDGNTDVRSDARSVYNAKQAAAYVGKDEKTVRNWIRTGRIHAKKPHGKWEIAKAELNAVLADEFKSGDRKAEQEQGSVSVHRETLKIKANPNHQTGKGKSDGHPLRCPV